MVYIGKTLICNFKSRSFCTIPKEIEDETAIFPEEDGTFSFSALVPGASYEVNGDDNPGTKSVPFSSYGSYPKPVDTACSFTASKRKGKATFKRLFHSSD